MILLAARNQCRKTCRSDPIEIDVSVMEQDLLQLLPAQNQSMLSMLQYNTTPHQYLSPMTVAVMVFIDT